MVLRFSKPLPASTALRFGTTDSVAAEEYDLSLAASYTLDGQGALVVDVSYLDLSITTACTLTASAQLQATYDNAVPRGPGLRCGSGWSAAATEAAARTIAHAAALPLRSDPEPVSAIATPRARSFSLTTPGTARVRAHPASHWGICSPLQPDQRNRWQGVRRTRQMPSTAFSSVVGLGQRHSNGWHRLIRTPRPQPVAPWGPVHAVGNVLSMRISPVLAEALAQRLPWGRVRRPAPGKSPHDTGQTTPPEVWTPDATLRFRHALPASTALRFGFETNTNTVNVPVRSIYVIENTLSLVLADTRQPLPATDISLTADADSWCWGWSGKVHGSVLAAVLGPSIDDLIEVDLTINGETFRLLVDPPKRSREFAKSDISLSGRSPSAWLGSPYAAALNRSNSEALTAQQLMQAALTENGVSNGWSVDWQINDWPVPAGVWQHNGTGLEACIEIASAAGAYLQTHPYQKTLRVLPRYPAAPWKWATDLTPDIILPEDVCTVEGMEWLDLPRYNTVYVAGRAGGIVGHVTRAGSDGGRAAPMVTDALMTHTTAARQRGLAILSDTGRQKKISLSLPVLPETGIIKPGQLVRYSENGSAHLGLCRAVSVSAQFPKLTQTITLESHVL